VQFSLSYRLVVWDGDGGQSCLLFMHFSELTMVGSRIYPLLFPLRSIGICYNVWLRSALFLITLFHQCPVLATAQRVKKLKILFPLGIFCQKSKGSLLLWKVINCVPHTVRIAVLLVTVLSSAGLVTETQYNG